jgi:hypothetical protein
MSPKVIPVNVVLNEALTVEINSPHQGNRQHNVNCKKAVIVKIQMRVHPQVYFLLLSLRDKHLKSYPFFRDYQQVD